MRRLRLGIPVQILLVSSFVLVLPWLGLELVREQQRLVLDGQERALAATARRAAVALSDRPGLLLPAGAGAGGVLRILDLSGPVVPDGQTGDWDEAAMEPHRLPPAGVASPRPLSAVYRIGRHGGGVYVLFEVEDAGVVFRDPDRETGDGDRLEIAVVTADDDFLRFAVDAVADGPVSAWLLRDDGSSAPDNRIAGAWRSTAEGYTVELRLPRTLVGARLAFAVVDVDSPETRQVAGRIESSATDTPGTLAVVLAPSPEMSDLLASLAGPQTQIWVIDAGKHILAHAGSLAPDKTAEEPARPDGWVPDPIARAMRTLVRPPRLHGDPPETHEVDRALAGEPATRWRPAAGSSTLVISATHPVRVEGQVRAAVLARETATDLLRARGHAFEKVLGAILAVALLGLGALLAFASRLSVRVRRLRDSVEHLEAGGREPLPVLPGATAADEVGDLARSVAAMAERQREQTAYLEQVGRRLSHEMRTPVGVVRSSLDNLRLGAIPAEARVYLDRADDGLRRLSLILSRLSEATRLEQTLAATERERYDLVPVVRGSVEGYRTAHPDRAITLQEPGEPLPAVGSPDLLAQMLDKLVDNALAFARPGTAVEVDLWRIGRAATLSVRNEGPRLPSEMGRRLFESMVSVRPKGTGEGGAPHLGLGLYIVRLIAEFHGGAAAAHDRPDGRGVIVTVSLPLAPAPGAAHP
ncbi:MAG: HAMP domain-containing protein [Acidobacteria bacterium]|nr:HAMP domain-containing protein [Acidobacteriota bacterium]